MKISTHFYLENFVSKNIFDTWKDKSIWFISPFMVNCAELLWTRFNKEVIINTWKDGGTLQYRGFREPAYTGGGKLSQHRFCNAIDPNVLGITPEEVYKDIQENFSIYNKVGLTTVEDIKFTTGALEGDLRGWNHMDGRWTNMSELLIVKP